MNDDKDIQKIWMQVEIWKKTVDVQQHFNEICMKIRNFYISVVSALLALMGIIIGRGAEVHFSFIGVSVHMAIPILAAIVLSTLLFYFIDRHWYHRLLLGSVNNALVIEKSLKDKLPGIGLSDEIGKTSPIKVSSWRLSSLSLYVLAMVFGSDKRIKEKMEVHSDAKIGIFYKSVAALSFVFAISIAILGGVKFEEQPEVTNSRWQNALATFLKVAD